MRGRYLLAILVAAAVLAVPVAASGASAQARVEGVVSGGGALSDATVSVEVLSRGLFVPVASVHTAPDGSWAYAGKAGTYRFTFSAPGFVSTAETLKMANKGSYTLDVTLQAEEPPSGTISGRITGASGAGIHGFVYFYRQNADGTWPDGYAWDVQTASDGTYVSPSLPLGTYKVRLFTVHTGVQWYRYAATAETATPIVLDTPGEAVTGIDAQYPPPAP